MQIAYGCRGTSWTVCPARPLGRAVVRGLATLGLVLCVTQPLTASRSAPPPVRTTLRLVFAGDVYFGESFVGTDGEKPRPAADAYTTSIVAIRRLFEGADAVVVNLETPLTDLVASPLAGRKDYLHRGQPERTLRALATLHVTAVGLANNHVMDYGEEGLVDTLAALHRRGIAAFGAGAEPRQAAQPWPWRFRTPTGRLDVLVAAGYEYNRRYDAAYDAYAEPGDEGVNLWTPELAAAQVRDLRATCPDALIVAFPHGGDNYEWRDTMQAGLHQALVNAGADLVLGHGSHMAQEVECYRGRWIVHGLGNGVFNTPGRYDEENQHPWSLVAALLLQPDGNVVRLGLRLYPILSDNVETAYRTRPASREEAERVAQLLNARSARFGDGAGLRPAADEWGWHFALDLGRRDLPAVTSAGAAAGPLGRLREAPRALPAKRRSLPPLN